MLAQQVLARSSAPKTSFLTITLLSVEETVFQKCHKGNGDNEGTAAADEGNLQPSSKGKSDGRGM